MDTTEVRTLVAQAQQHNQIAFGQLYDMYASRLYRFINLRIPQREQAEDVLQETFLKAWQALPKLDLTNLYFGAWLYKIARNLTNDYYRAMYRRPRMEDIDEHYDLAAPGDTLEATATILDLVRVREVLIHLKPEHRQVLELRFVQDFSVQETAKVMGKTQVAVRLIQLRAIRKLRSLLITEEQHETAGL